MRGRRSINDSWQAQIYLRLRDREWHTLGPIFEEFEQRIPLHHAMRNAMHPTNGRTEMPMPTVARWKFFLGVVSQVGVECSGSNKAWKWNDQVRIRYVKDRACKDCNGPVIWATWKGRSYTACLWCEELAAPAVAPLSEAPRPAPDVPEIRVAEIAHDPPPAEERPASRLAAVTAPEKLAASSLPPPPPSQQQLPPEPDDVRVSVQLTGDAWRNWHVRTRRDFARVLKREFYPWWSLNQIERELSKMDMATIYEKFKLRLWFGRTFL